MAIKKLDDFLALAAGKGPKNLVVVAADDHEVLAAVKQATALGLVQPILVGCAEKIQAQLQELNFSVPRDAIIHQPDHKLAAQQSVQLINQGIGQILMKGLIGSADFLRAILDKEHGLKGSSKLLSHVAFFESPYYHKVLAISDAAQNVAPTFEEKVMICNNAVKLLQRLGVSCPKVAVAAAVETVNAKMEATVHAAMLTMMNRRKQITGCLIDGPLAVDNIVSKEAAEHKGIVSEVAGDADLILAPDIEAGNMCYKSLTYLGGASVVGIIVGATVPVVLTSRSDHQRSKLLSIALAAAISG